MSTRQRVEVGTKGQPILEEIMEATGLGAGEAVTLILTRYGRHFLSWYNSSPETGTTPAPSPPPPVEIPEENLPAIEL